MTRAFAGLAVATWLLASACEVDRTAILVHVCIEAPVRAEIDWVRVVVDNETGDAPAHVFPLPPDATVVSFSLRPGADLSAPVDIVLSVVGLEEDGRERIRRTVRTSFDPGADRDVAVTLEAACLDRSCVEAETCAAGTCGAIPVGVEGPCPDEGSGR